MIRLFQKKGWWVNTCTIFREPVMILGIQWSTILCALEYLRMVDVNNSIQWPSGVYEAKHLSKCVPENACPQLGSRRIQKDRNAAFIAYICPKIDPLSMANAKVQCSKSSLINNTESPEEAEVRATARFQSALTVFGKLEQMYQEMEELKMQSQMLLALGPSQ